MHINSQMRFVFLDALESLPKDSQNSQTILIKRLLWSLATNLREQRVSVQMPKFLQRVSVQMPKFLLQFLHKLAEDHQLLRGLAEDNLDDQWEHEIKWSMLSQAMVTFFQALRGHPLVTAYLNSRSLSFLRCRGRTCLWATPNLLSPRAPYVVFLSHLARRLVGPTWSREGRCWQRGLQTWSVCRGK